MQAALSGKTTPPLMRAAYLWCVLALCSREEGEGEGTGGISLSSLPLACLERTSALSSLQLPTLEEAIVALHVAVKVSFPDPIPPLVWNLAESHVGPAGL